MPPFSYKYYNKFKKHKKYIPKTEKESEIETDKQDQYLTNILYAKIELNKNKWFYSPERDHSVVEYEWFEINLGTFIINFDEE